MSKEKQKNQDNQEINTEQGIQSEQKLRTEQEAPSEEETMSGQETPAEQEKREERERRNRILDILITEAIDRRTNSEEIQMLYEEAIYNYSDKLFERLYTLLEKIVYRWVGETLLYLNIHDREQREDVFQESRQGLAASIRKDAHTGCAKDTFVKYAVTIYKNKTYDIYRSRFGKKGEKENIINTIPLDLPLWDDEGLSLAEKIGSDDPGFELISEQVKLFRYIFIEYCKAILNSDDYALKNLALMFGRVFPHMFGLINDTKQASSKMAHKLMQRKTVWGLKEYSEKILNEMVGEGLVWGESFLKQIYSPCNLSGGRLLKDIVYTDVIDQKQTSHWADAQHKNAVKAAFKAISSNKEMLKLFSQYIERKDILFVFANGGKK